MRIHIVSDLHAEVQDPGVSAAAEIVIAAGDIGARDTALPVIDGWLAAGARVVLVLGNHEFYKSDYDETLQNWSAWKRERPGLHVLNRDSIVLDGVRFLGATLWTDFDGEDPAAMEIAQQYMPDFRVIRYRGRPLHPRDTVAMHRQDRRWLASRMGERHDGPTVVVTHHLPHEGSVAEQHVGSPLNPAFVSDLDALIRDGGPLLWVHGHTHTGCDYIAHATRVICNPLGYPGEAFTTFDPALVVEVPTSAPEGAELRGWQADDLRGERQ